MAYQEKWGESESCSVLFDSLRPHRLYSPWNSLRKNTGVGNISLLQGIFPTQGSNPGIPHLKKVKSLSHVRLFVTPWTVAHQPPPSMEFLGKSTGVGCHFLLQGIFPTQGLNQGLRHCRQTLYHLSHQGIPSGIPALKADSLPAKPQGTPKNTGVGSLSLLQTIFQTQELNWCLLHCRWILYQLSYLDTKLAWKVKLYNCLRKINPIYNCKFMAKIFSVTQNGLLENSLGGS